MPAPHHGGMHFSHRFLPTARAALLALACTLSLAHAHIVQDLYQKVKLLSTKLQLHMLCRACAGTAYGNWPL